MVVFNLSIGDTRATGCITQQLSQAMEFSFLVLGSTEQFYLMTFFTIKYIYFHTDEYPEKQYNTRHKHILIIGAKALHRLLSYVSVMFSYLEQQVHSACVRRPPDSVI
jgi:hypothetical protein